MKRDLMDLLRADTAAQERLQSYGLDPSFLEEIEMGRAWRPSDPTAETAIANVDREMARRRRKANR